MNELPEPLTPQDCDLRSVKHIPIDVRRLRDSDFCALANGWEFKAGIMLYLASWHQVPAASLPDEDEALRVLSKVGKHWRRSKSVALRGWINCSDGRLYHPFIAKLANDAWPNVQRLARKEARRLEVCSFAWERMRSEVFARDNYTCRYCGDRGGRLECDHVNPVALGGPTLRSNLVTACRPCNRSKGSKLLEEWAA